MATSTGERLVLPGQRRLARGTVAVLMGGGSEREVSLVSGAAVVAALSTSTDGGDDRGPARVRPIELLVDGRWRVEGRTLPLGSALEELRDVDVFFLALHGGDGEGGILQGLLRAAGKRFTGSDVAASAIALDKAVALRLVEARGLRTPPGLTIAPADWARRRRALLDRLAAWDGPGWVVKPRCGGSSVGIVVVRDAGELPAAIEATLDGGADALVETLLDGIEATCGVLGGPGDERALTPIEIRPHEGRFFDYEEKYSPTGAAELCPPVSFGPRTCARLAELAVRAHRALGCGGYSRSDFFVPTAPAMIEDGDPEPIYLETNTLPGLTPRSLLPRAALCDGIDFRTLCLEILRLGLEARRSPR